jgi:hypothetical protein
MAIRTTLDDTVDGRSRDERPLRRMPLGRPGARPCFPAMDAALAADGAGMTAT